VAEGDLELGDAVASRDGESGASAVLLRARQVVIDGNADTGHGVPGRSVHDVDAETPEEDGLVVVVLPGAHDDQDATGLAWSPARARVCGLWPLVLGRPELRA